MPPIHLYCTGHVVQVMYILYNDIVKCINDNLLYTLEILCMSDGFCVSG